MLYPVIFHDMLASVGFALTVLALVLNIVGVVLSDWLYWSVSIEGLTATIKFGLWKCCTQVAPLQSDCIALEDMDTPISMTIKISRGFAILSLLFITMTGTVAISTRYFKEKRRLLLQVAAFLLSVAGSLITIGAVVFNVENTVQNYLEENAFRGQVDMKPHTGFALFVTSGILCFVAASLCCMGNCFRTNQVQSDNA